ncbi:hypothetical protein DFH05DRAFT_1481226 [Lentinula detonsa]|uniref:Uncharacterized protein n=1 Tax=Lentinula detonsa TaxID=2804962 RepID=A0A9W8P6J4_9AGAR|nr:hypothetical protein DFH05DRAFT_1481226 [Lentinula detonsa]
MTPCHESDVLKAVTAPQCTKLLSLRSDKFIQIPSMLVQWFGTIIFLPKCAIFFAIIFIKNRGPTVVPVAAPFFPFVLVMKYLYLFVLLFILYTHYVDPKEEWCYDHAKFNSRDPDDHSPVFDFIFFFRRGAYLRDPFTLCLYIPGT